MLRVKLNRNQISATSLALRSCLLLTAAFFLSACKEEAKVTTEGGDPTGVYTLVSVNGNPVPASVSHDNVTLQVKSGTFTIHADGTCGTKTVFVPPSGPEATREVTATYAKDGSTLKMQWKGAGTTKGSIEGNTFTMNNEGMIFVFRK